MKIKPLQIVALVLLVAGLAVLIYGIITFADFRNSAVGRLAEGGRSISRGLFGTSGIQASTVEKRAIACMIGGGVGVIVGGVLLIARKKR